MEEKEILVEITYYQLYGKPADDGSTGPMLIFYRDGTYFIPFNQRWDPKHLSQWKVVDNVMWVRHSYNGWDAMEWKACIDNEGSEKITQIVLGELAEYQMLIGEL